MTIEERIKEIAHRVDIRRYYDGYPAHWQQIDPSDDITFLLSELKRCREALEKIQTRHPEEFNGIWSIAQQALHPEGVK